MALGSQVPVAPHVQAVFDALERAGVRWCLLRGETDLGPTAHDLDLLVSPEDVPALAAAVRPLGFVAVPTPAGGSHRFFVSYVRATDRWLILDVVTELSYGPDYSVGTGAAAGCLARRQAGGSVALPAPDDAFWALLLHRLLDRGSFRARDEERLLRLVGAARTDGPLARFTAAICPDGWDPAAIVGAVSRCNWDALSGLGAQLLGEWRRKHVARFTAIRLAAPVARRLGPRFARLARPGLRVALVADEAATATELAAALARSFYLPVTSLRARRRSAAAAGSIVARLQQLRGRLVVLPVAAPAPVSIDAALRAAAPGFRAQLVLDIRRPGSNGSAPEREIAHGRRYLGVRGTTFRTLSADRRELTADLWRAYCERGR